MHPLYTMFLVRLQLLKTAPIRGFEPRLCARLLSSHHPCVGRRHREKKIGRFIHHYSRCEPFTGDLTYSWLLYRLAALFPLRETDFLQLVYDFLLRPERIAFIHPLGDGLGFMHVFTDEIRTKLRVEYRQYGKGDGLVLPYRPNHVPFLESCSVFFHIANVLTS